MTTMLVTGAAGFIGSNLVKAIYRRYDEVKVVGIDNMNDYYDPRLKEERLAQLQEYPDFLFIKGNIADKALIEKQIKEMPNYFADYDTTVNFISMEELKRDHSGIPHGGFVLRSGKTGAGLENNHLIEYSLKLDSNPEFTASVIIAYARAA